MTFYPNFSRFLSWSKKHSVLPLVAELPASKFGDPFALFRSRKPKFKPDFYLDGLGCAPQGGYSYFPLSAPRAIIAAADKPQFERAWLSLKRMLNNDRAPRPPGSFPAFFGGAVGFLSYDCGRAFEPGWKTRRPPDALGWPWMAMGIYDDLACFDHKANKIYVMGNVRASELKGAGLRSAFEKKRSELARRADGLFVDQPSSRAQNKLPDAGARAGLNQKEDFVRAVRKIQNYIAAGDIYQANLSRRVQARGPINGADYFARLRAINPSPYAFYANYEFGELASCSPELLIKKRGTFLETRPIAGTRPRGSSAAQDRALRGELLLNPKERAEHVMLLDLERNDLARVSAPGAVRVGRRMYVEKYSHVMHIVSRLCGRIRRGADIFDAIEAMFPGGTITGCPKIRCMQILDELEPVARGPFFGSFGWIGYQGDGEMNLMIRTAVMDRQTRGTRPRRMFIQAGSGIVADSVPSREFEESGHKARALLEALKTERKIS